MHEQTSHPAPAAVPMQAALSCWVQGRQRATCLQQTETSRAPLAPSRDKQTTEKATVTVRTDELLCPHPKTGSKKPSRPPQPSPAPVPPPLACVTGLTDARRGQQFWRLHAPPECSPAPRIPWQKVLWRLQSTLLTAPQLTAPCSKATGVLPEQNKSQCMAAPRPSAPLASMPATKMLLGATRHSLRLCHANATKQSTARLSARGMMATATPQQPHVPQPRHSQFSRRSKVTAHAHRHNVTCSCQIIGTRTGQAQRRAKWLT